MHMKIFRILLTLFVALTLSTPGVASSKSKPLPGLMDMFTNFLNLEEQYRSNEWNEATGVVSKIEGDYLSLVGSMKGTVDTKLIQKFGFLIKNLKSKLAAKDLDGTEQSTQLLMDLFFQMMDFYDYPNPPALIVMDRYLHEAHEESEEGHLEHTVEGMEQFLAMQGVLTKGFAEKGLSEHDINEFFALVAEIKTQAENGNKEEVLSKLDKIDSIIGQFAGEHHGEEPEDEHHGEEHGH